MKARELAGIVAALILLSSVTLAHARNGGPGDSVRGLHSVFVSVHVDGNSLAASGLTNPQVWSAVVLRLRLAGLSALNEEEWEKTQGKPYLYVSLSDTLLSEQAGHPADPGHNYCHVEILHAFMVPFLLSMRCSELTERGKQY